MDSRLARQLGFSDFEPESFPASLILAQFAFVWFGFEFLGSIPHTVKTLIDWGVNSLH